MYSHRLLPVLTLVNKDLVKTTCFRDPNYLGDPLNAIKIFNDKEVDELVVFDISASKNNKEPNYSFIESLAGECFIPLTYGGGVSTIEQAARIFSLGIEKVSIQTAALKDISFIQELANRFGSQSIVATVDIKKPFFGEPYLYSSTFRKARKINWLSHISNLVDAGVGELILNSVDKDGTLSGPELELIRKVSSKISIPLVALGGISSLVDVKDAVDAGASAVAASSFFVYHGPHKAVLISYPSYTELQKIFQSF